MRYAQGPVVKCGVCVCVCVCVCERERERERECARVFVSMYGLVYCWQCAAEYVQLCAGDSSYQETLGGLLNNRQSSSAPVADAALRETAQFCLPKSRAPLQSFTVKVRLGLEFALFTLADGV